MENRIFGNRSILWKIHCSSQASKLFFLVSSSEGRSRFWAENAKEENGIIHFQFINGQNTQSPILEKVQDEKFSLLYFNSLVIFRFIGSKEGGVDVILENINVLSEVFEETKAGWVSVLLALKAYADFGVDLRNHNLNKSWDDHFVDN